MNYYFIFILSLTSITFCIGKEGLEVNLLTNLEAGNKNVTKPFLDKFEKDMKKIIMNANLHEDDFGDVERKIINNKGMFSMSYITEKGIEKCSQAIILTEKAVNDVKEIVKGSIKCGDMSSITFNKK
ncbi:Hypothetical protein SRAE_1000232100 [Strongyloides ratti]|uniref:Proteinase inhibitor I25, cystatin domain-containing protein n=1 Tax=Strongyloides ratti TaxID=34506 RepID=A0A090L964_STRRB|nr:Hypothetical protein SRAE_1000232100 [Strongyloides ratti]CEF64065.1 Hypothetical protein SRAE_1000232100 [Strongyloides ratti]